MGTAAGSEACIAGVVRNAMTYGNIDILECGYGIPLRELLLFAGKQYPGMTAERATLHAITVIMFKLEGQLIVRNHDFELEDRLLLHRIDRETNTVAIDGTVWPLRDMPLPTVTDDAYALTEEESAVMAELRTAFRQSPRLRSHVTFFYRCGWMYRGFQRQPNLPRLRAVKRRQHLSAKDA